MTPTPSMLIIITTSRAASAGREARRAAWPGSRLDMDCWWAVARIRASQPWRTVLAGVPRAPAPGQDAAKTVEDRRAGPAIAFHRRRAAAFQLAPADLTPADRGADRLHHHVVHQLAVAEALDREPDQILPGRAPLHRHAERAGREVEEDERGPVEHRAEEIVRRPLHRVVGAGVERPDQAPDDRQVDQRRHGRQEDLEQPDLRQG